MNIKTKIKRTTVTLLAFSLLLQPVTAFSREPGLNESNPIVVNGFTESDQNKLAAEFMFRSINKGEPVVYFKVPNDTNLQLLYNLAESFEYNSEFDAYGRRIDCVDGGLGLYKLRMYDTYMDNFEDFDRAYDIIDQEANIIMSNSKNIVDTIIGCYNKVYSTNEYNYAALETDGSDDFFKYARNSDVRGSVLDGKSTCHGFSAHLAELLSRCGIPAIPWVFDDYRDGYRQFHSITLLYLDNSWVSIDMVSAQPHYKQLITQIPPLEWAKDYNANWGILEEYKNRHLAEYPNPILERNVGNINKVNSYAPQHEYYDWKTHGDKILTRGEFASLLDNNISLPDKGYPAEFVDVDSRYQYHDSAFRAGKAGVMGLYNTKFNPGDNISRVEAIASLNRAFDINKKPYKRTKTFKDISDNFWGSVDIYVASSRGLVNGYPDGTVKPNKSITESEALALINNYKNKIK